VKNCSPTQNFTEIWQLAAELWPKKTLLFKMRLDDVSFDVARSWLWNQLVLIATPGVETGADADGKISRLLLQRLPASEAADLLEPVLQI